MGAPDIVDKRGMLDRLSRMRPAVLELGCGSRKRLPGAVGIDIIDDDCVDVVGDVYVVLGRIPDAAVDKVFSHHFLEHVRDVELLVRETARILRTGGEFEIVVPHFSNPYFHSDLTHRTPFGLYTFSYLSRDALMRRKVPHYGKPPAFRLVGVDLVFKSAPPFYLRHVFKRLAGLVFNSCRYLQEFYEENLCYMIPCYEIRFSLRRIDDVP